MRKAVPVVLVIGVVAGALLGRFGLPGFGSGSGDGEDAKPPSNTAGTDVPLVEETPPNTVAVRDRAVYVDGVAVTRDRLEEWLGSPGLTQSGIRLKIHDSGLAVDAEWVESAAAEKGVPVTDVENVESDDATP